MAKASGLGKGLSALISERKTDISEIAANSGKKDRIALSDLFPGRFQPRKIFDDAELNELAESIQRNGVLQPILVKKRDAGRGYEIIAGERRWRASKQVKLRDIPVIILDIDDKQAMEIALVENIQRQNLKVLEEAEGYKKLIKEFDYTQEQLADVIGKSRSYVTNILRLNSLPDEVKNHLNDGKISTGHARAILSAPDSVSAANEVMSKNLSVRQTENLVKKLSKLENGEVIRKKSYSRKKKNEITELDAINEAPSEEISSLEFETNLEVFDDIFSDSDGKEQASSVSKKDPEIILLEEEMSRVFGFNIEINNKDEDGEVVIKYATMKELDDILTKLEKAN